MSGLFFVFHLATKALYRAANIYCPLNNLRLSVFCGKIGLFHPDFASRLIAMFLFDLCKSI